MSDQQAEQPIQPNGTREKMPNGNNLSDHKVTKRPLKVADRALSGRGHDINNTKRHSTVADQTLFGRVSDANIANWHSLSDQTDVFSGYRGHGAEPFAYLAALSQNGLIRAGVETIADAMTSEWITLKNPGDNIDDDRDDRLARLEEDMRVFGLQHVFARASALNGYFGGCLVYIDTDLNRPSDLVQPLMPTRDSLKRFTIVEPSEVRGVDYNTDNPLSPDYYRPRFWQIGNMKVHNSHFLYFSSGDLSPLLRRSYGFFGISQSQIVDEYVADFTRSRRSALRLLDKVSRLALKTRMEDVLAGGSGEEEDKRIALLARHWTNDDIAAIDMNDEDFVEITASLSGVIDIVRLHLEMLPAAFRMPVMKYLGISPSGLNATGEADIRSFRENIGRAQETQLNVPLERALGLLQVNRFGEADPGITFEWNSLEEKDEITIAQIAERRVNTLSAALKDGVISRDEYRARLRRLEGLGLEELDPDKLPDLTP